MTTKKVTTAKAITKALAVQVWYGENQSLLKLELARWQDEFRKKYPDAQVTKLEYEAKAPAEQVAALHQATRSGGLFATRRFVVVRGALSAEAKSDMAELVRSVIQAPPSELVLILAEGAKVTWSKPLYKLAKELAGSDRLAIREFVNLEPKALEAWVAARVREQGASCAPGVAQQLARIVGNDFFRLNQEIAKLVAYRKGDPIKLADLDLLVESQVEEDVFAFIDAVGRRDVGAAQASLLRQLNQGTSPQNLVGLLAWHLRVLTSVRSALDEAKTRLTAKELAVALKLHPYVVSKTLQHIPYYSKARLASLYMELSDLDVKLKTRRLKPEVLFALFLSKLATLSLGK